VQRYADAQRPSHCVRAPLAAAALASPYFISSIARLVQRRLAKRSSEELRHIQCGALVTGARF
jgi:hypothetical protein